MPIGLKKEEVRLVPFDLTWKTLFNETKQAIARALHDETISIEHIGSTAIEHQYQRRNQRLEEVLLL